MKPTKKVKVIAIFLLLNFLNYIFTPAIVYALSNSTAQSNSAAGEMLTSMVDTKSGDFHYEVPLLEVPGPEGGYPLTLGYQAGIKTEQDASWVGLGWNFNPGSISRSVKGIPDDFSGQPYKVTDAIGTTNNALPQYYECIFRGDKLAKKESGQPLFIPFEPTFPITIEQYGSLHGYLASNEGSIPGTATFDCHALYSDENETPFISNPEIMKGGSLPMYDDYLITGSELNGQIEPLILENASLFRSIAEGSGSMYTNGKRDYIFHKLFTKPKQQFRFKGEFSNSFIASATPFSLSSSGGSLSFGTNNLGYSYTLQDANGFDEPSLRLAGGNHIDYFLNEEITAGTAKSAGFIEYRGINIGERTTLNYTSVNGQQYSVGRRVGGFSITTIDGTTYHYALPVYTFGNTSFQDFYDQGPLCDASRSSENLHPYAYEWKLTTITGTDFIDKNNNGYADEGDLGKWINFDYGKWTNAYIESTPYLKPFTRQDNSRISSTAYKEMYFLDAIYTRSHTAIFSKSGRDDCKDGNFTVGNRIAPLKLNSIFLFHNDGIKAIKDLMGWSSTDLHNHIKKIKEVNSNTSVITVEDLTSISNTNPGIYEPLIQKESRLTYDYSLCQGAPNSTSGKLTLKSVRNYGKNGSALAPSTDFGYELPNPKSAQITVTQIPSSGSEKKGKITVANNPFVVGDILGFSINSVSYYAALLKATTATEFEVMFVGPNLITSSELNASSTATQTKNPAYSYYPSGGTVLHAGAFFDDWGYLKIDFVLDHYLGRGDRKTTPVSAKATDCWSLRKITTSLGAEININYESDSYYGIQLQESQVFNIEQVFKYTDNTSGSLVSSSTSNPNCDFRAIRKDPSTGIFEFTIKQNTTGQFAVGQKVEIATMATLSKLFTYSGEVVPGNACTSVSGKDQFEITYVDEANRIIRGKFIEPSGGSSARSNPFWKSNGGGGYDQRVFYHNTSLLLQKNPTINYGGGLRVASIKIKEGEGEEYEVRYNYVNRNNGKTSGTTAFEPGQFSAGSANVNQRTSYTYKYYWTTGSPYSGYVITNSQTPSKPNYTLDRVQVTANSNDGTPFSYNAFTNAYTSDFFNGGDKFFQREYKNFQNHYYTAVIKAMANSSFVSSEVLYEYVTVTHYGNGHKFITSDEYQFQPYTWDVIQRVKENEQSQAAVTGPEYSSCHATFQMVSLKLTIKDYTSGVGNLLAHTVFDQNDNPVTKTVYEYMTSGIPLEQGRLDQVFHEERYACYKPYNAPNSDIRYVAVVTVKSDYPTVLKKVFSYNYLKNISTIKFNHKFNFYTGEITENVMVDSYGNCIKAKNIPAYIKYPEMGIKLKSTSGIRNRNMLSQVTGKYSCKVDPSNFNNEFSPLSSTVDTWDNSWSKRAFNGAFGYYYNSAITNDVNTVQDERIWRKKSTYVWKSPLLNNDGSFSGFVDFNWSGSPHANWQKASEVVHYDQFSHPLEVMDINGNSVSAKYGYDYNYLLIASPNSNISEIAFSSGEDINSNSNFGNPNDLGGEIIKSLGTPDATFAHTGTKSIRINQNQSSFIYRTKINSNSIQTNKDYRVSVWIYDNGNTTANLFYKIQDNNGQALSPPVEANVSLSTMNPVIASGNWKLLTLDIKLTGSYNDYIFYLGCFNPSATPAYFDDFRFHPLSEQVTSYVYDKNSGLITHTLDPANFYTRKVYDNMFRVISDYKETINGEIKKNEYEYNFGRGN